jgi:type IV secretory pathway VirJ component
MTVAGRLALLLLLAGTVVAAVTERSANYWRVGELALYVPAGRAGPVVLLVSGAKGWQERETAAARELAGTGAVVVGIDGPAYLDLVSNRHDKRNDSCVSFADDFDAVARFVEKETGFPGYVLPVLVGLDEGAALVHAALAQALPGTFRAGIGAGFCPTLAFSRPLCPGTALRADAPVSGTVRLRPAEGLASPWVSIPQTRQAACDPRALADFARAAAAAEPSAGPIQAAATSSTQPWAPLVDAVAAFSAPAKSGADQPSGSVEDLPLVEVGATTGSPATDLLAVLVTGDGGWAGIDKNIGRYLSERGIPVVGVDALRYFWAKKTPAVAAADLERVLRRYLPRWGKKRVLLIGYSLGAEAALIMAEGLPPDLKRRLALLALLGPAPDTDLEVHVGEWIGLSDEGDYPLAPVAARLVEVPVLCVYSDREKADSLCPHLGTAVVVPLPGNHHFDDDYERVGATILGHVD